MKKWLSGFFALGVPFAAMANDPPLEKVCAQIDQSINAMLGAPVTNCLPAKSSTPGAYVLIIMAKQPLLSDPHNRRALLVNAMAGAGWAMAELPEMKKVKIAEVRVMDVTLAKSKSYIQLSGADVKRWRNEVFTKKKTLQEVSEQIEKSAREVTLK
ncbi:hypothetical protein [Uliginosibacterium gangwonense]|uniref:hypothetical protein n=1 Tax=Uliginosibacterium gangwonense TaxID=392736 RepID=UPI0003743664|nr:hypothetical protein [Uliginosibacterium gangwonense]